MKLIFKFSHYLKLPFFLTLIYLSLKNFNLDYFLGRNLYNVVLTLILLTIFAISFILLYEFSKYFIKYNNTYQKTTSIVGYIKSTHLIHLTKALFYLMLIEIQNLIRVFLEYKGQINSNNFLISLIAIASFSLLFAIISYILFLNYYFLYKRNYYKNLENKLDEQLCLFQSNLQINCPYYLSFLEYLIELQISFNKNIAIFLLNQKPLNDLKINSYFSLLLTNKKKATTPPSIVL
ncbi:hypothetical protein SGLAD_v1c06680 [Spiroplasma gladiatoris]|uniref:Transmembrane protein n=1 Tax=Spiroplasma gladiatoris TaxID=2143 RepID=A0A4P7AHZ6_9MOLU|nr:hypothetical protein [Spiroplasma gladiatoris]QBQ07867.1 hypothetical protein SGLAD_v1c06680 [Spiroplasma gladiatoris]